MKGTVKLIKRFLLLVICVVPLLFAINLSVLISFTTGGRSTNGGWTAAKEVGEALSEREDGSYLLSEAGEEVLAQYNAWGILVEDKTGDVIWHSDNLPEEIPLHYSVADVSWHTRGYIEDYPTTTGAKGNDLVILGHPKTSYWKLMWNAFDYDVIAGFPGMLLTFLAVNGIAVFLIYMILTTRVMRSVKPVIQGMEAVTDEEVHLQEKGFLAEVAGAVNRVNGKLRDQEQSLRKKENARAEWISGVSHDIRTPLSMVMGYASELEGDAALPEEVRKKAGVIRRQSVKMKDLVGNLNLASKLEYQMQPLNRETLRLSALLRRTAADFVDSDPEEKYPLTFVCPENAGECMMQGDGALLQRAVYNVLSNSRIHNPQGCRIGMKLCPEEGKVRIIFTDDGKGATAEQLEELRNRLRYMTGTGSGLRRHGLGLLIVHRIAAAHGGEVRLDANEPKGFLVEMILPQYGESRRKA